MHTVELMAKIVILQVDITFPLVPELYLDLASFKIWNPSSFEKVLRPAPQGLHLSQQTCGLSYLEGIQSHPYSPPTTEQCFTCAKAVGLEKASLEHPEGC